MHLQDEFDDALENIIFEPKIIYIEKDDKKYDMKFGVHRTNKKGLHDNRYDVKYTPQNDIHADTIDNLFSKNRFQIIQNHAYANYR